MLLVTIVVNFLMTNVFSKRFHPKARSIFFTAGCKEAGTVGGGVFTKVLISAIAC